MAGDEETTTTTTTTATLETTSTWAVASVCFILIALSILIEHALHLLAKVLRVCLCPFHEYYQFPCLVTRFLLFSSTSTRSGGGLSFMLLTTSNRVRIILDCFRFMVFFFFLYEAKILYPSVLCLRLELMLLGFVSLLLTVCQKYIAKICIPRSVGETFLPCKTLTESDSEEETKCEEQVRGKNFYPSMY